MIQVNRVLNDSTDSLVKNFTVMPLSRNYLKYALKTKYLKLQRRNIPHTYFEVGACIGSRECEISNTRGFNTNVKK